MEAGSPVVLAHRHQHGIEGAQLLALAAALVSRMELFDRADFFATLLAHCETPEYREKIAYASKLRSAGNLGDLGNGIEALESAPTAIAAFALHPHSYEAVIGSVILLGGDTDTIAAMAGALAGAYLGRRAIPDRLVALLERSPKGHDYLVELSAKLLQAHERVAAGA